MKKERLKLCFSCYPMHWETAHKRLLNAPIYCNECGLSTTVVALIDSPIILLGELRFSNMATFKAKDKEPAQ